VGTLKSCQLNQRLDAQMTALEDRCLKQARRSLPGNRHQSLKFCECHRIRGELRTRAVDGAIRSPPLTLNEKFRPGHDFSSFAKPLREPRIQPPLVTD
jgi:hypothetical protein